MAASLTFRSSNATTNTSNTSNHNNNTSSSWQDVTIPRRRPVVNGDSQSDRFRLPSETRNNNTPTSVPRKRPRSDDEREGVNVGEARSSSSSVNDKGDYSSAHSNCNNSPSTTTTKISTTPTTASDNNKLYPSNKKSGESKRASFGSSSSSASQERRNSVNSDNDKTARRSSIESVKSTTSTNSSGSGSFRRLKKFSPDSKKIKKNKKSPSSPATKKESVEEAISVSDSFQQTQLRLWKAAQERHMKLQEVQGKKKKKKNKKKLREQLVQQEREEDVVVDDGEAQPRDNASTSSKQQSRNDVSRERTDFSIKKTKQGQGSIKDEESKSKKSTNSGNDSIAMKEEQVDEERDALKAKKKLKKLKKLQRLSGQSTTSAENSAAIRSSPSSESSSTTASEATKKKKKKRRLMKLGSFQQDGGDATDDLPRKKKKKIFNDDKETGKSKKEVSSYTGGDIVRVNSEGDHRNVAITGTPSTPRTPERKIKLASALGSAPLTPLSMGLADTVKTRVRSCNKAKDELELLQAASFEKKKRKKGKNANKASMGEDVSSAEPTTLKKKKKKKKKQRVAHGDDVYDADVEAPTSLAMKKRAKPSIETMSDVASSETSSSATVVTGKIKKKKRLKKFGGQEALRLNNQDTSFDSERPLPLKKRMAMAAAAAESASWERNAASTTASKISVSSAGVNEFGTEASSISEFTHPLGAMCLPLPPHSSNMGSFHKQAPVPREILSKPPTPLPNEQPFGFDAGAHATVVGPTISSSDDSDDSSSDSDTDEEELFSWANKMFGTSAKPAATVEANKPEPTTETTNLTAELCEMERRRQRQEEARTLSVKEVNAILKEEQMSHATVAENWVRRSVRQPSRSLLNAPLTKKLLDKLRGNDADMVILKMKKYLSSPDTPSMLIDAALEALEENTNCEALYIQNFNLGVKDKQVLHLLKILQQPSCSIWCLNIGETYNVSEDTWETFAAGLKKTKVTHMYASEHTITAELKDEIRETIRLNRKKHNMHNDPNNLDVIIQCTHCWWNPFRSRVLLPYLRKRGFESLLDDPEAQGLRGSHSEAPAG